MFGRHNWLKGAPQYDKPTFAPYRTGRLSVTMTVKDTVRTATKMEISVRPITVQTIVISLETTSTGTFSPNLQQNKKDSSQVPFTLRGGEGGGVGIENGDLFLRFGPPSALIRQELSEKALHNGKNLKTLAVFRFRFGSKH